MKMFLSLVYGTLLLFWTFPAVHSSLNDMKTVPRPREMAGGYSQVENIQDNPQLLQAATFALKRLSQGDGPAYSFVDSLAANLSEEPNSPNSNIRIIRAFQQVVAGLNYRLVVALVRDHDCFGAFAVTIYDHFGDLSITTWGKEIQCSRAMAALENQDLMDAHAEHFSG